MRPRLIGAQITTDEILTPGVYFYQVEAENRCGITSEEGTLHITY